MSRDQAAPGFREALLGRGLDRYAPIPDLASRGRDDRAMSLLQSVVIRYMGLVGAAEYRPEFGGEHHGDGQLRLTLAERDIVAEDENVVRLSFAALDGSDLPRWQPGQHLDIHLPSGRQRQYSLCGRIGDRSRYTIAVRKIPDGGGGSVEMHELKPGDQIDIFGPRNGFPFLPEGPALFLAGGIGITPILSMVRAAHVLGMDYHLVYAGRSRESLPFLDELGDLEPARVRVRFDDTDGIATGEELLADAPRGGAVYCCGPAPMLAAVRAAFPASPANELHFERFGAAPVEGGEPFEIRIASNGAVVQVGAEQTALAALREAIPTLAYSCQQGFCGTCRVGVLCGEVDHRDHRLSAEDRETAMLPCVSRAAGGRITLDL